MGRSVQKKYKALNVKELKLLNLLNDIHMSYYENIKNYTSNNKAIA